MKTDLTKPRKDWDRETFEKWKEGWYRDKGCPYFACSQALFRKVCGNTFLCGNLFDYKAFKNKKWIKECDIKLAQDETGEMPTKSCPGCMGSMCLKRDGETGTLYADSWCPIMNNWYASQGIKVNRKNEKYLNTWGVYIIPITGEKAYLEMVKSPELLKKFMENPSEFRENQE